MLTDAAVVILAAGQGTRMKSRLPKVLHCAGGKSLVRHSIDTALEVAPRERVFVVVGFQGDKVRMEAEAAGAGSIEQTEQLGTGHAVLCGRDRLSGLGGRLIVSVGDCPLIRAATLEALSETVRTSGAAAAMITTDVENPAGYGRIIRNAAGDVTEIVEHKACTPEQLLVREINSGIFCFDANLFWKHVGEIRPDNAAREYYLTDMVSILIRAGHRVAAMKLDDPSELLGINNRIELAAADRILRERKVRQLMTDGVTIEKPETVTIDSQVRIGIDTIVGPFAQILGDSVIGENVRIGACSIIDSSIVGDDAEVFPFSMIAASTLDAKAHAGPFARIRMGAHLAEGAHIGNFVEVKKSRIGAGAKSMHLAYLGDSTIGDKSNIGAGTITCNYDGQKKHPTIIGDGAFIGSNSTLVAPVEIEGGAYVAAGSVITHKVPAQALAVGRSRQVNKEGWRKRFRNPVAAE
ncbi:MAG TPA: bifunctional UDP-N-acetylglucosamine diphosphorylase/glucosamine-1-phosphate N-acetyltransferase GlmU [Bryobacteraceae bacterium]|nr:bifunctional UDP-N-acetylglucosamine diphosphorylase/glucosamine-1-phosphate N-acetyltransferase GlmU [Bryobacteraceae bacterium]